MLLVNIKAIYVIKIYAICSSIIKIINTGYYFDSFALASSSTFVFLKSSKIFDVDSLTFKEEIENGPSEHESCSNHPIRKD